MTADEPAGTTITVDGHLSGEAVEPVRTCCVNALLLGKPVRLYLRDVAAIDDRGRSMLRRLAAEGVALAANGLYSSYLIEEIQSAGLGKGRALV